MRRRISLLLAVVLAYTTLMLFGPVQPASGVVVCASVLSPVTVSPGLLYPVLLGVGATSGGKDHHLIDILIFNQTNVVHGFFTTFTPGCVHVRISPTLPSRATGSGILKGYCGHSSGIGTINGQQFAYVSGGTFVVLTGAVVGVATALPVPLLTGSCLHAEGPATVTGFNPFRLPSGATQFILDGLGIELNCSPFATTNTLIVMPEPTLLLPSQLFGLHVGRYVTHIWLMLPCVPEVVLP